MDKVIISDFFKKLKNEKKKKELSLNAGGRRDAGLVPGLRRSPGGGHDDPLQYSSLEKPRDRGALQAIYSP